MAVGTPLSQRLSRGFDRMGIGRVACGVFVYSAPHIDD
jgi:hypothetical protein